MADFPKLSDLPDDMTVGELRKMSEMLRQPSAPSSEGFSPSLNRTFASAREPSLREKFIDALVPFSPSPVEGASPLAYSGDRDAYRAAEASADNPIASFGLDLAQGGKEMVTGSPGKGLGRIVGGSYGVDGNPWFDQSQIATEPDDTPGFMEAQAEPSRRRQAPQPARIGPKAARAAEAGKGEADALRTKAASDAEIAKEAAKAERELKAKKDAASFDADAADKKARTPFRQNYPGAAGALHFLPAAIAAGAPAVARRSINNGIEAGASRLSALVDDFNKARAAGDLEGAALAKLAIEGEEAAYKKAISGSATAKGYGSAAVGGGVLNMGGATLPEGYDMANMPEGPERQYAKDRILSLEGAGTLATRFGVGAAAGIGGHWGVGGPKRPDILSKAGAASSFGTPKFDETVKGISGSSRNAAEHGAATKATREISDAVAREFVTDKPAIPSVAAAKQIEGPAIKPMLDPEIKGKYLANKDKIKELTAEAAKPRPRVKISDLRAQIRELESENTMLKATVMQHNKTAKAAKN